MIDGRMQSSQKTRIATGVVRERTARNDNYSRD